MAPTPRELRDRLKAATPRERPALLRGILVEEAGRGVPSNAVMSLILSHPGLLRPACEALLPAAATRPYARAVLVRLFERERDIAALRALMRDAVEEEPARCRQALRMDIAFPGGDAADRAALWARCGPTLSPIAALSYGLQRAVAEGAAPDAAPLLAMLADSATAWGEAPPPAVARLLAARDVALVGNGSFLAGSGAATRIEAHDCVARINFPVLDGHEGDVGRRTDVMLCRASMWRDLPALRAREPGYAAVPLLALSPRGQRAPAPPPTPPGLPRALAEAISEATYFEATTGFMAILLLAAALRRKVTLFGFDFFAPGAPGHYFGPAAGVPQHELAYERWFSARVLPVLCAGQVQADATCRLDG